MKFHNLVQKVNRKLARYNFVRGSGEDRGLREAMEQDRKLKNHELVEKVQDLGERLLLAMAGKQREIGSSVEEWRFLLSLLQPTKANHRQRYVQFREEQLMTFPEFKMKPVELGEILKWWYVESERMRCFMLTEAAAHCTDRKTKNKILSLI
jgi:hypothetical protein